MQPIDFHLSTPQLKKLAYGRQIQLKNRQIGTGIHRLLLKPSTAAKVIKAYNSGKGLRIQLDAEEIEKNGEGFKKWMGKLWGGIKSVYNKVLKPILSPLIRTGLKTGISALSGVTGLPLGQLEGQYDLVNRLGNKTNAFGLKKRGGRRGGEVPPFMMNDLQNGALSPIPDYPRAPGLIKCPHCGSGFRPAN